MNRKTKGPRPEPKVKGLRGRKRSEDEPRWVHDNKLSSATKRVNWVGPIGGPGGYRITPMYSWYYHEKAKAFNARSR